MFVESGTISMEFRITFFFICLLVYVGHVSAQPESGNMSAQSGFGSDNGTTEASIEVEMNIEPTTTYLLTSTEAKMTTVPTTSISSTTESTTNFLTSTEADMTIAPTVLTTTISSTTEQESTITTGPTTTTDSTEADMTTAPTVPTTEESATITTGPTTTTDSTTESLTVMVLWIVLGCLILFIIIVLAAICFIGVAYCRRYKRTFIC